MTLDAQPTVADLAGLTPHQRQLWRDNVSRPRPPVVLVGRVQSSLATFAWRHKEAI